jgi:hypothetical protein
MNQRQEDLIKDIPLIFPELAADRVLVERDWIWIAGRMPAAQEDQLLKIGFKWSPRNQKYYHTCGVEPKGRRRYGNRHRFSTPRDARKEEDDKAKTAQTLIEAVVAKARA